MNASIENVLTALDGIINSAVAEKSAAGYFPALYRRVTAKVKTAIEQSAFEDNERMERLVLVFAQRYLDAYEAFKANAPATHSWQAAFRESNNASAIVLQHLLLGMNAHINLDLGIAAATVAGDSVLSLKRDFYAINDILGQTINDTQSRLTRIFGQLGLIDNLLGPIDERLSLFSITYARDKAWTQTLELALADSRTRSELIAKRDAEVASFAKHLIRPPRIWIRLLLLMIRMLERGDIPSRIQILRRPNP